VLTRPDKMKLHTLLGSYPNAVAMKDGRVKSDLIEFDFPDFPVPNRGFKPMVREHKFDCGELAIVTFLQAREFGGHDVGVGGLVEIDGGRPPGAFKARQALHPLLECEQIAQRIPASKGHERNRSTSLRRFEGAAGPVVRSIGSSHRGRPPHAHDSSHQAP